MAFDIQLGRDVSELNNNIFELQQHLFVFGIFCGTLQIKDGNVKT